MKSNILVVGGYGQVGKVICTNLSAIYPGKIKCAGRNLAKAKDFALLTEGKVFPKQLDIYNIDKSDEIFNDTAIVIMCLDQKESRFVELCIEHKIHYIDISPSYTILSEIEKLNNKAKCFGTTIVLGVGLAPGLSNLLVKQSKIQFDHIKEVDMYLMLGIGERHGRDGVEWLLNNLNTNFYSFENGYPKLFTSFSDGKRTKLSSKHGIRTAYRFDLADQHIVQKTLEIESVSSRFCYDSTIATSAIARLKRLGIFRLLKITFIRSVFISVLEGVLSIFQRLHIGTDAYAVKAEVKGIKNGKGVIVQTSIYGKNNTEITGRVASFVADRLIKNKYPKGIFFIEQLFELDDLLPILSKDISFNYEGTVENFV
ncbi:hypothetical protein AEA09_07975 [Lysinibacillus contaminans]|uniref:Saccharopine dehydrogenase NADP binding domain-containing protein n=2 Tax=Lysinibacillus contaminans TaxID=1293441 RepID=A0ABR5K4J7_9BACI|nr:hypothetical protein AEA09_07975 [Lysinibacillus contaminans]